MGLTYIPTFPAASRSDGNKYVYKRSRGSAPSTIDQPNSSSIFGARPNGTYTNPDLMKASECLRKQNEFYITESDEEGLVVLWNSVVYEKAALRYFSDSAKYQLVADEKSFKDRNETTPKIIKLAMEKLCDETNEQVNILRKNGFTSAAKSEKMKVVDTNQKMPYVFFQLKISKTFHPETGTFQARAIVETACGPLYGLDSYLCTVTNPIMDILPCLVHNSTQLMERIDEHVSAAKQGAGCFEHGHTSKHIGFAAAHADGLIPSTEIENGLVCVHQVYESNNQWLRDQFYLQKRLPPVDPENFRKLLRFVLSNTCVSYENRRYYWQNVGVPSGALISKFLSNS